MDDTAPSESSLLDIAELENKLQDFAEQVARDLKADIVTLYLYDADRDRFYMPVACGLRDEITFKTALPRTDRLAGKILKDQEPVVAGDARSHPDMAGPFTFRERVKSAAGFPILLEGRPAGVFFVSFRRRHAFTDRERETIQECLREVSSFLGAAQLAQVRQSRPAPTASMIDRSLDFIVNVACTYANAPVALWMLEPTGNRLSIQASTGLGHHFVQSAQLSPQEDSVFAEVMRTGQPMSIAELKGNFRFPFPDELRNAGWKSLLAAPVVLRGQTAGVLAIFGFPGRDFGRSEESLLAELAQRISDVLIIVNNLQQVSMALSASVELEQLLQLIVEKAAETFGADAVTLYPFDQEREEFGRPFALGVLPEFWEHPMPSKTGIAAQIVRDAVPVSSDDAEHDDRMSRGFIERQGVKSSAGFPLVVDKQVVGVLFINYRTPHRFLQSELELLSLFAGQAAVAIMKAHHFEEEQRRATVAQIANTFGETFDRQKTLQAVVEGAQKLTGASSSSLFLFASEKGKKGTFELSARSPKAEEPARRLPRSTRGLSRLILDTGQPILIGDTRQPGRLGDTGPEIRVRAAVVRDGVHSILGVPVRVKGERVGVLYVNSEQVNHFREPDKELLQRLADYGAVAIERTRLLDAITEVNRATGEILRLDEIIRELLSKIVNDLQFEFAALQLVNWELDTIETVDSINAPWGTDAKHSLKSNDIQAAIVRSRRTEVISRFDSRFDPAIYQHYGHERLVRIFVPVIVHDTVLGTVEAGYNRHTRPTISEAEQASLKALVREYADKLWRASLPYVLEVVVANAVRMVRAHSGSIHLLWDQDRKQHVYQACAGRIGREFLETFPPREHGIGEQSLRDGRPLWIDDADELARTHEKIYAPDELWDSHPEKYRRGEGVRAIASFPVVTGGKYEGVFYIHFWEQHKFTDDEISWLQLFAGQVSTAIQNTQFYEKLQDRTRALTSLSMIGQSVLGELRLDSVLTQIAQGALDVLKADIVTIYQFDEDRDFFPTPPTMKGRDLKEEYMQTEVRPGDAPWAIVHELHRSCYAENATSNRVMCNRDLKRASGREPFVDREGIESAAGILLKVSQETVGVMFVNYRTPRVFADSDRRLIENFASYAAVAIRNARKAIQQRVDQMEKIQKIDQEISSTLDLDSVLHLIVDTSMRHLEVTDGYGSLQLYDDKTQELVIRAAKNLPPELVQHKLRLVDKGITPLVARTMQYKLVGDFKQEPDYQGLMPDVQSELAVPLMKDGLLVGVLNLESRRRRAFDDADVLFLKALADQAVVAIRNAQYVEQLKQLRKVLGMIPLATDQHTVLDQIAASIQALLRADEAVIFPYDPDRDEFDLDRVIYQPQAKIDFRPGQPQRGGIAYTVLDRELLAIDDIESPPPKLSAVLNARMLRELGIRAFVGVALKAREHELDRNIGVLYLDYQAPHQFTDEEQSLVRAFADQAAIAIGMTRTYEALRKANEELVANRKRQFAAETMATLGDILGNLVHRMNTRIGAIQGLSQRIRGHLNDAEYVTAKTEAIETIALESLHMIGELDNSLETGKSARVDLNEAMETARRRISWSDQVVWKVEGWPTPVIVSANREKLVEVFRNLFENAVEALGDEAGTITMGTQSLRPGWAEAWVADTGQGISQANQDKLFEPFFTTKQEGKGLGYGLWWLRTYVRRLGGEVSFSSEVGQGTRFVVELPLDQQ
jgi:GAF domain-containing protein